MMKHLEPRNEDSKQLAKKLKARGIKDENVLKAIASVPRDQFVCSESILEAYYDKPLPIGEGQTISQPFTVAYQTELLELNKEDKVLEIGTGSGYQAAILCEIVNEVYSVERHKSLYQTAKKRLSKLNYQANLFYGDGYKGLPNYAPFDKIIITAAAPEIPENLLTQLTIGGKMVLPLGNTIEQTMIVINRLSECDYRTTRHGAFRFVPMIKGIDTECI